METAITIIILVIIWLALLRFILRPRSTYYTWTKFVKTGCSDAQGEDWVQEEPVEYYDWEVAQLLTMQTNELAYQEKVYAAAEKCAADEAKFAEVYGWLP